MLSAIEEGSEEGSQETWHHTKSTETKSVSHESPSEAKSEEAQMLFEMKVLDEFIDAIHMAGLSEDQAHKMVDIATRKNGHVDTEVIAEMLVELRTDNSTKEPKDDGESKELITPDKLIVEDKVAVVVDATNNDDRKDVPDNVALRDIGAPPDSENQEESNMVPEVVTVQGEVKRIESNQSSIKAEKGDKASSPKKAVKRKSLLKKWEEKKAASQVSPTPSPSPPPSSSSPPPPPPPSLSSPSLPDSKDEVAPAPSSLSPPQSNEVVSTAQETKSTKKGLALKKWQEKKAAPPAVAPSSPPATEELEGGVPKNSDNSRGADHAELKNRYDVSFEEQSLGLTFATMATPCLLSP